MDQSSKCMGNKHKELPGMLFYSTVIEDLRLHLIACPQKGTICSHCECIKMIYACYYFREYGHPILTTNLEHWQPSDQISRGAETQSPFYECLDMNALMPEMINHNYRLWCILISSQEANFNIVVAFPQTTTDSAICSTFRDVKKNCAQWTENRPSVQTINIKLNNVINEVLECCFS